MITKIVITNPYEFASAIEGETKASVIGRSVSILLGLILIGFMILYVSLSLSPAKGIPFTAIQFPTWLIPTVVFGSVTSAVFFIAVGLCVRSVTIHSSLEENSQD